MSQSVNDVLSAIRSASEALEREPALNAQITSLKQEVDRHAAHNAGLESNIISYKSTIESLNERVRSLEVERDQAQFRTLELEDSFASLREAIGHANQNACQQMDKLFPRPPEPVAEQSSPVAEPHPFEGSGGGMSQPIGEQVPASPPSTPNPESSSTSQPTPTADPVGFTGLSEADVKPPGKYEGLTWSQEW